MYKMKLGLGISNSFGVEPDEQIKLFSEVGFEAFFSGWGEGVDNALYRKRADECNVIYQSIHAPFDGAARMWLPYDEARRDVDTLVRCAADTAKYGVPIMVVHAYIGFVTSQKDESHYAYGIDNYKRVVEAAGKLGVKIAFENTEGEEYLAALMNAFKGYENVGFCWDTGHEMCYNYGKDMTAFYGDRLIATHINDNLGVKSFDGTITWHDDLHLLPFDGIADWENVARRIADVGYDGILTFELLRADKPGRFCNMKYRKMSPEEYLSEAYARACKVSAMVQKCKQ